MREEWRDVVGYEGLFEVSNLGRVRGKDRYVDRCSDGVNHHKVFVRGRELKQSLNTNGYLRVVLTVGNKNRYKFVHRLVAEAFVPRNTHGCVVDHINSDRTDNRATNLQWVSQGENLHLGYARGNHGVRFIPEESKERQRNAVSKPVRRSDGVVFRSVKEAARALGVTNACVSHALNGRCKTVKGYSFEYV